MVFGLHQLRAFLAVADQLHFGRAAQQLHISQPALSQQIRLLERDMGASLFVRTSRMVELTPAGRALAEAAPGSSSRPTGPSGGWSRPPRARRGCS